MGAQFMRCGRAVALCGRLGEAMSVLGSQEQELVRQEGRAFQAESGASTGPKVAKGKVSLGAERSRLSWSWTEWPGGGRSACHS